VRKARKPEISLLYLSGINAAGPEAGRDLADPAGERRRVLGRP